MKVCQTAVQIPGCEKAIRQFSKDHSVGWPDAGDIEAVDEDEDHRVQDVEPERDDEHRHDEMAWLRAGAQSRCRPLSPPLNCQVLLARHRLPLSL